MDNDDIKLLLVRYITNQATEAEVKEVKHWIGLHPENELYFVELYEAWQNMLHTKPEIVDEEKAYQVFLTKTSPKKQHASGAKWLKIAAVLALLIGSSVLLFRKVAAPLHGKSQVIAQNGAIKKLTLNDSTVVWLNAGSTIKYDENFDITNRTVYLEGEAFFEIGPNRKKIPFLVKTKKYTIRDIGTKFNLKAYPADPYFETTVVKGEVAVEDNQEANTHNVNRIYVKPHQVLKIYYQPEKGSDKELTQSSGLYNEVRVSQIDSAKIQDYDGWKDDLLVFDGITLNEIAKVLERRYDVKIAIEDPDLQNIRYSGSFKSVPDIDKVLHIIKLNTPIAYTIAGQNITITKTN